ncbi:MAG: permease-like cell division protein FtsX [Bacteroides sp.]|nr:permease-like cell division protein FtsX [Ruminococcus flavefaciens]MCM1555366.1 permease-like cell division protein FtsX [Bacteroides sp.]
MIQEENAKFEKKRIRSAHVTTVLSIATVLFLLCIQGLMMGYTHKVSDYVKENIGLTLMIKDYTREQDILEMKEIIDRSPFVKSSRYISKAEAARELQDDLGQDFVSFLGYNPLLPSIEIHLKADYATQDSIAKFEEELTRYHIVKEMFYQPDLIQLVNDNVAKISFWLGLISLFILVLAVYLLNNTMRLLIYSKRFTINTMQLVGATASFIRRPFLRKSMLQGLLGAVIAIAVASFGLIVLHNRVPEIINGHDSGMILRVFTIVLLIGLLFTLVSAWFSVNKYLRMRNSDNLYN